jgi:hypothetical protein
VVNHQINIELSILSIYSWHESNQWLYMRTFRVIPLNYSIVWKQDRSMAWSGSGPWLEGWTRVNTWGIEDMYKTQQAGVQLLHCSPWAQIPITSISFHRTRIIPPSRRKSGISRLVWKNSCSTVSPQVHSGTTRVIQLNSRSCTHVQFQRGVL